jgi:hypothetical protein
MYDERNNTDMNSGDLPVQCPYCSKEFDDARGIKSHFLFNDDHPNSTERFKKKFEDNKRETPPEDDIIKHWSNDNYPDKYFIDEVPVQTLSERGSKKYIDIMLFETFPFNSEQEYEREMKKFTLTGRFRSKEEQVKFVLKNLDNKVRVRIFEAKREFNFKSIGQIIAYSEFLPEYYSDYADIEIVERGIIYGEEDEMCFKTAKRHDISPHPVRWNL